MRWPTRLLDLLPVGIVLLQPPRRVHFMNRAAKETLDRHRGLGLDAAGMLQAPRPPVATALTRLITDARARATDGGRRASTLTIEDSDGGPALSVVATRFEAGDVDDDGCVALFLTVRDGEAAVPAEVLAALYGLTAAEASVLGKLLRGLSAHEIAEAHGVSINTVRSQLKILLEKTETRRQAELVGKVLSDSGVWLMAGLR